MSVAGSETRAEVQRPVPESGDQDVGARLAQHDLHAGMGLAEVAEQRRHVRLGVGRHHPHRHAALHEPREVVDRVAGPRDGRERGPGVRQHRRPDRRRAHSAGAIEQLLAELALEAADLRAHARLGDVQPLRGAGEAPFVGDGDEVLELAQFHNGSF